jgi:transaldolase
MLLVDTADPTAITEALAFPGVQGFTTNPTLISRASGKETLTRKAYVEAALRLCALATQRREVRHFMIQSVGDAEAAISQAATYAKALPSGTGAKLWIKLPPIRENLTCCRPIAEIGCATLVTAVLTPAQAYVAMEAGADGVAVYLGRLMRTESDWRRCLEQIVEIVGEAQKLLLLASFQSRETIETGLSFSRDLTLPPALLGELLRSAQAEEAIHAFEARVIP